MREALVILIVIVVLLALTAVRYRKQILGMIGLARTLKELRSGIAIPPPAAKIKTAVPLVSCFQCGIWVPKDRVVRSKNENYCSEKCSTACP